jgi:RHS repeat-associated protein
MVSIRHLIDGSEVAHRVFAWCDYEICEERTSSGVVLKRFFAQGMKVESGAAAGNYFYTRDHLGSIREMCDGIGSIRARYGYDVFGRRTRLAGDMDADFGFAGMMWSAEVSLNLTMFRAYDPNMARWLTRDPKTGAEVDEGINLFVYARNDPVNVTDRLGLCCESQYAALMAGIEEADAIEKNAEAFAIAVCGLGFTGLGGVGRTLVTAALGKASPKFAKAGPLIAVACAAAAASAAAVALDQGYAVLQLQASYSQCMATCVHCEIDPFLPK